MIPTSRTTATSSGADRPAAFVRAALVLLLVLGACRSQTDATPPPGPSDAGTAAVERPASRADTGLPIDQAGDGAAPGAGAADALDTGGDAPPGAPAADAPPPFEGVVARNDGAGVDDPHADEAGIFGTRATPAGDDAPLPAPDEVPSFLGGSTPSLPPPPPSPSTSAPAVRGEWSRGGDSLDDLMRHVRIEEEGSESEGSFASVVGGDPPDPGRDRRTAGWSEAGTPREPRERPVTPRGASRHDRAASAIGQETDGGGAEGPSSPSGDPSERCEDVEARIAARMDFLRRVAAERDSYAYVENHADATALRLLAAMRRCAEHPDDEDCRAPPMEVKLRDVEPPRRQYEVRPNDLEAEHRDPDDVPQDPGIRELLHQLESCRRRHTPQPLLHR